MTVNHSGSQWECGNSGIFQALVLQTHQERILSSSSGHCATVYNNSVSSSPHKAKQGCRPLSHTKDCMIACVYTCVGVDVWTIPVLNPKTLRQNSIEINSLVFLFFQDFSLFLIKRLEKADRIHGEGYLYPVCTNSEIPLLCSDRTWESLATSQFGKIVDAFPLWRGSFPLCLLLYDQIYNSMNINHEKHLINFPPLLLISLSKTCRSLSSF